MSKQERTILFNFFVSLCFAGFTAYSAYLAYGSNFSKATYFFLIGSFIFSLRENLKQ
jgi:hypothetical protein